MAEITGMVYYITTKEIVQYIKKFGRDPDVEYV